MIDHAKSLLLVAGDRLLGWMLLLPRDAALVLLAAFSAGLLLALRRCLTDQSLLRSVQADRRQLRRRMRQARAQSDASALKRYRRTRSELAWMRLRCELPALLVSAAVLVLLLGWAGERFGYLPPQAGERLRFAVLLPAKRMGEVIHLVPRAGLRAEDGWVRRVERDSETESLRGVAAWTVIWSGERADVPLIVRLDGCDLRHPVLFGQREYAPARRRHGPHAETVLDLREYVPFSTPRPPAFPSGTAWQPAFFLLALALFYAGRYAFGVA